MSTSTARTVAASGELAAALDSREAGGRMIAAMADEKGVFATEKPAEMLHGLLAGIFDMAHNGDEGEARARLQALCRAVGPYLGAGARMMYPMRHKFLTPEQPAQVIPLAQAARTRARHGVRKRGEAAIPIPLREPAS